MGGVEGIHVHRRRRGQLFNLPFADAYRGSPLDRGRRVGERAGGLLHSGQLAQPGGLLLGRQVAHRVGRVQIGASARSVGDTGHRHRPEPGGQLPGPAPLRPTAALTLGVDDLLQLLLPTPLKVEVVLHEQPACCITSDEPHPLNHIEAQRSPHRTELRSR
jgi:hypothetical protein